MAIQFENPAEAFAAVATIVIATDNLGTVMESDFLFEQVKNLGIFRRYDQAEFTRLLSDAIEKAYKTLPVDGSSITRQGIEQLIQAIRQVLDTELGVLVFEMAFGLARADGLCDQERTLLEQLQHGLGIDDQVAQDILRGNDSKKLPLAATC